MKTFSYEQLTNWKDEHAYHGAAAHRGILPDDVVNAYREGIRVGYRYAINDLKLHGAIRETFSEVKGGAA